MTGRLTRVGERAPLLHFILRSIYRKCIANPDEWHDRRLNDFEPHWKLTNLKGSSIRLLGAHE
ncbi:hypothetical protein ACVMIH_007691 [Bradyrhizobium sp. USDA 4503]